MKSIQIKFSLSVGLIAVALLTTHTAHAASTTVNRTCLLVVTSPASTSVESPVASASASASAPASEANSNSNSKTRIRCLVSPSSMPGSLSISAAEVNTSKLAISGTAVGAKTVRVLVRSDETGKTIFSKTVRVSKDTWKMKTVKKVANGEYSFEISTKKGRVVRGPVAPTTNLGGTIKIGTDTNSQASSASTFVVGSVPLLSGGIARAGTSVPVSYLQVTNTGSATAYLTGFWVKQNGNASVKSVIGLTTVDDTGTIRDGVVGAQGTTPFKSDLGFAPINATFAPGQMRLFTIKAVLGNNPGTSLGKQLVIDVESVETKSSTLGPFPIRGTTWTIAY